MKLGAVYPQIELQGDVFAVGEFARGIERLGYDYLLMYDHVIGAAHEDRTPKLTGPYTEVDPFHDPLVMFGHLAGITERLEFATGVLILPQRQTALVAKQATDVDLLSRERLRLGVGSGWNYVEYEALGKDFHNRGKRLDEQIDFLRKLWTEPLLTYHGQYEHVERGSLNIRPKRPIPIWIGGFSEPAFRRGARLGDGFIVGVPFARALDHLARIRHHLAEAGRNESGFGLELIAAGEGNPQAVASDVNGWRDQGGTHACVPTMGRGFTTVEAHLEHLAAVKQALG